MGVVGLLKVVVFALTSSSSWCDPISLRPASVLLFNPAPSPQKRRAQLFTDNNHPAFFLLREDRKNRIFSLLGLERERERDNENLPLRSSLAPLSRRRSELFERVRYPGRREEGGLLVLDLQWQRS